jgi:hypothetical protein
VNRVRVPAPTGQKNAEVTHTAQQTAVEKQADTPITSPTRRVTMKKFAFVSILVLIASTAQVCAEDAPAWGLKAGLNGSSFYGDDTGPMKTRFGAIMGGYVEYPVTELISLQGEVLYSMKGWKNEEYRTLYEISYRINYIEIPMLVRINSPCSNGAGPYLIMGPALSFKAGSDFEVKVLGASAQSEPEDFGMTDPKGTEVGFVLGGGITIPAGNYTIGFEVRGNGGLTDTFEDREIGQSSKVIDAKHVSGSVVFTVAF